MPDARILGPYRLERVLGTGSFATVWLASDDLLDRLVAVKILADNWSRDNDVHRRFLAEARVLLSVESPRIIRAFHLGETDTDQPYLVMAYADRGTLGERIEERRRDGRTFDPRETVAIAAEIAAALVDVHASGHLHRDVKPRNVLIRSSPTRPAIAGLAADETIVLGDFGLARGLELSALTLVAGSPGYVAPEQAAGIVQLNRRADLYSLGRIILEMLTGDPGGQATTMAGAANEEIDVADLLHGTGASPELVALIGRLVASDRDDRPATADEVVAELGVVAQSFGPPAQSAPPPPPEQGASPTRGASLSGRQWVAAAAGVLLAAIAVVVVFIVRGGDSGGGAQSATSPPGIVASTEALVVPDTTEPVPESTAPVTTEPGATTHPETTDSAFTSPSTAQLQLDPAWVSGSLGGDIDPARQEGTTLLTAGEFAAELVALNPDWEGAPPTGDDRVANFAMTGYGRTANVHAETRDTAGIDITRFEIVYT